MMHIATAGGSEPVIERLGRIKSIAEQAVAGTTTTDDAIAAISAIAPSLAPVLKALGKNNSLIILAMILWFVAEMTKAMHGSSSAKTDSIHIENSAVHVDQSTSIDNRVFIAPPPPVRPTDLVRAAPSKEKLAKRQKRRLRGKAKRP